MDNSQLAAQIATRLPTKTPDGVRLDPATAIAAITMILNLVIPLIRRCRERDGELPPDFFNRPFRQRRLQTIAGRVAAERPTQYDADDYTRAIIAHVSRR